jgi:hypothetical protein
MRLESSQGLLFLSKTVHPHIKQEDEDSAFSNESLPLCVAFKMHSGVPPCQSGKSHEEQLQTLSKNNCELISGPRSERAGPIGVLKHKQKNPMQLFAHTPLDAKESQVK